VPVSGHQRADAPIQVPDLRSTPRFSTTVLPERPALLAQRIRTVPARFALHQGTEQGQRQADHRCNSNPHDEHQQHPPGAGGAQEDGQAATAIPLLIAG
jgi:hypothetical protein